MRVGSHKSGNAAVDAGRPAPRYRVYECAARPNAGVPGFHVAINQEHLDELIAMALFYRFLNPSFQVPRRLHREDRDGAERASLRAQIERSRDWLESVHVETKTMGRPYLRMGQERIVMPRIFAAEARIAALEELHPQVSSLMTTRPLLQEWAELAIAERRDVIEALVVPVVDPVRDDERGRRGLNERRVRFVWR